jgi:succinate dehydrogenase / fumarate reductase iron-sulfur subunit
MEFTLHIWRQKNKSEKGRIKKYNIKEIDGDMSFLEMLDSLNYLTTIVEREFVGLAHYL